MLKKISFLLALAVLAFALVSCTGSFEETGDISVVIENTDGEYTVYKVYLEDVKNKDEGVVGILENLKEREENSLAVDMSSSQYGAYINSIGGLIPDAAKNEFISVYTSLEADFGTWDGVGTVEYEGTTLKASGLGLSSMSVASGMIVLFRVESY